MIKKYTANWSTEMFTIAKVLLTNPITYILKDVKNEEMKGCFCREQLQKVKFPNVYLVEKIIKKNKNKVFVKWLRFDSLHNSWISKDNVV